MQILESSRDLTTKRRVNLEAVAVADVLPALQAKTDRLELLTEAASLQAVFEVLAHYKNKIAFAPVDTGVQAYDRYVLLHYLASLGNAQQSRAIVSLAETYVISLLRKVQQSPLRMEQIAYLNQQVDALPANAQAERFLRALQNRLSPDLAAVLDEKLDYWF